MTTNSVDSWGGSLTTGAVGTLALTGTAEAFGQRPGLAGVLDSLAVADRSLAGVEWWSWPAIDAAVTAVLIAGSLAAVASAARRHGSALVWAAAVARRLAWVAVLVVVLTAAAHTSLVRSLDTGARTDRPEAWAVAAVAVLGIAYGERRLAARWLGPPPAARGPARWLSADPRAAALAAVGVLAAGFAGVGLVAAMLTRLALEVPLSLLPHLPVADGEGRS